MYESHRIPPPPKLTRPRPKLTAEAAVEYLDWITENIHVLSAEAATRHMHAVELAIRTRATDAQGKATQHTLVEQGIIDAPPAAIG